MTRAGVRDTADTHSSQRCSAPGKPLSPDSVSETAAAERPFHRRWKAMISSAVDGNGQVKQTMGQSANATLTPVCMAVYLAAASLSFFSGRTLTLTVAGLAANHCSCLVNGLIPL